MFLPHVIKVGRRSVGIGKASGDDDGDDTGTTEQPPRHVVGHFEFELFIPCYIINANATGALVTAVCETFNALGLALLSFNEVVLCAFPPCRLSAWILLKRIRSPRVWLTTHSSWSRNAFGELQKKTPFEQADKLFG